MKLKWLSIFASFALANSACSPSKPTAEKPAPAPTAAPELVKVAKQITEVRNENPACFGSATGASMREFTANSLVFKGDGYTMASVTAEGQSGKLVVGVISDIKEFLPETVANLKAFSAWINTSKAQLVVVNGDVAYSQKEMESVLRVLGAELKVPILVSSGNKELARDFDLALTNVSADFPQIINGNRVRSLRLNDITFVTLPGYGRKNYTEPGACLFGQLEINDTAKLLKAAAGARVLVAHASPLQSGADAVDFMVDGKNVGDERIAKMLTETGTKFAIVGNIKEAGGRAATVAGQGVKVGLASEELVLNPGPADSTPWSMVDKSVSYGMAALITFDSGKASYQIHRVKAPKQ